ncbi:hypothetical protein TNCV_2626871 [Trichonephila clavipes]|uniref:Uncharacterized protein n=1 Tax=Trichonephila clavipes TaxID=2585209 RepID=A0A8X6W7M8_TRICX|nr:hypothetical protein TNCV_2626871 [Trichonephila clavipes]
MLHAEDANEFIGKPLVILNLDTVTRMKPELATHPLKFHALPTHIKIMFDASSFADPTPLAHADTSRDVLPRGGTSQAISDGRKFDPGEVMKTTPELAPIPLSSFNFHV